MNQQRAFVAKNCKHPRKMYVWDAIHAVCSIGRTSSEGLVLCTIAQEGWEPTGDSAGGNNNMKRAGKLKGAGAVGLKKRGQWKDMLRVLMYLKGHCKEEGNNLFLVGRVRCNGSKLHHGGKAFLMVTLVRHSFMLWGV